MDKTILQYQISDWSQLSNCMSNNSPELKIIVCNYVQNDDIEGTKIEVHHPVYGTLLAYTISPKGNLITDITDKDIDVMHTQTLLNELRRYGFYVDFVEEENLPEGQINLLKSLKAFNFDKLRICSIHSDYEDFYSTIRVTAFNIKENPYWINSGYSPSKAEWENALLNGSAFNVSGLDGAEDYSWDWVYNAIIDIEELLEKYEDNHD